MRTLTAGWDIARTAWRQNRRRGLAFAVALSVNGLVIAGFVASINTLVLHDGRAIEVMIVPPFAFQRVKPVPPRPEPQSTETARIHAAPPSAAPNPLPSPLPATPVAPAKPAPPQPGKSGRRHRDLHSQLVDQPSAQRYLRAGAACSKGELWKLSREEQDRCLVRFGSKVPPDDGMHHHPPPNDPGGEFARAVAAQEEQARPMQGRPWASARWAPRARTCTGSVMAMTRGRWFSAWSTDRSRRGVYCAGAGSGSVGSGALKAAASRSAVARSSSESEARRRAALVRAGWSPARPAITYHL